MSFPAAAFETRAREAILIDANTGTILLEKNADVTMPPASMSKLMTVFMVFEALKEGRLSMEDQFPVSEKAWRMGGSKMFVEVGNRVRVADLLRGVIIQSGNDACIVLAEGLAGTEEAFADRMTKRAREVGLTNSTFANATGWPDERHRMTARDLARLATLLIERFPEYYPIYAEKEFVWQKIKQQNRNPLLYLDIGADGLKTGHTDEAGYGLVGSSVQNGRRLVMVITGLTSTQERAQEAERVMAWGFREFETRTLFDAGTTIETAEVWMGDEALVPLVLPSPLTVTLPVAARRELQVSVEYQGPVAAPLSKGDAIAILRISAPGMPTIERSLVAGADVGRAGIGGKLMATASYLFRTAMGN